MRQIPLNLNIKNKKEERIDDENHLKYAVSMNSLTWISATKTVISQTDKNILKRGIFNIERANVTFSNPLLFLLNFDIKIQIYVQLLKESEWNTNIYNITQ